jgi:hypothetical protein
MEDSQIDNDIWKRELLKASIIYGNKFFDEPTSSEHPSSEERDVENILLQQYWDELHYSLTSAVNQESANVLIRWHETNNTFTQANLLNNEDDEIQKIIIQIRKLLSIPYSENLANILDTLNSDVKEEDVGSVGITSGSLRSFYNFIRLNTNLKWPTVSLTPENNIYASWRTEQSQIFSVHFLPNEDVRFVIFKPSDRDPERKLRFSGTATTSVLIETVEPHGVLDWISE